MKAPFRIRHVAIAVTDHEKTARMYEEVFGLRRLTSESPGEHPTSLRPDESTDWILLTDGHINIAILGREHFARSQGLKADILPRDTGLRTGVHHIGLEVPDLQATLQKAIAAGFELFAEYKWGDVIKLKDPDGVIIDIGADTHWPY